MESQPGPSFAQRIALMAAFSHDPADRGNIGEAKQMTDLQDALGRLDRISQLVGREPTTSLANRIRHILDEPAHEVSSDEPSGNRT